MRLLPALALLCAPAVVLADAPGLEEGFVVERDNVEIAPAPGIEITQLEIDNRLGDITIIGRDQPGITLAVVKRAPDEETLERLKVNLVPDPSGIVRISSALLVGEEMRAIAAGTVRIDIQVHAPRAAAARARAWNGNLGVTGMHNGADVTAHEGQIVVTNVKGPVVTRSMRGRQRLSDVSGPVTADETFGDVDLDGIRGESLAARVHRGTVTATRIRSRTVSITTTFGDIHFRGELAAGGRYELRSYRGNVDARAAGAFEVEARSRDGVIVPTAPMEAMTREARRLTGRHGSWRGAGTPPILVLSSTAGNVTFGLAD
jgi:hypothetical protein